MVEDQNVRSDLYYRLNVFPISVPALRERKEDIPLLVRQFVQEFSRRNNRGINTIPSETMETLVCYHWPGNIRELQNVIERAVIISENPVLHVSLAELDRDVSAKTRCRSPVRSGMQVFRTLWMRRSALRFCTPSKRRNGVVWRTKRCCCSPRDQTHYTVHSHAETDYSRLAHGD